MQVKLSVEQGRSTAGLAMFTTYLLGSCVEMIMLVIRGMRQKSFTTALSLWDGHLVSLIRLQQLNEGTPNSITCWEQQLSFPGTVVCLIIRSTNPMICAILPLV